MIEPTSHLLTLDGLRMRYLAAGAGRPLILLHGGGTDSAALSWGEADGLVPLAAAVEACGRLRDCRLAVLAGAGHWAQRERPGEFVGVVEGFLG